MLPLPVPLAPLIAESDAVYVLGVAAPADVTVRVTVVEAPEPSVTELWLVPVVQPLGPVLPTVNVELEQPESWFVMVAVYVSAVPAVALCVEGEIDTVGCARTQAGTTV